MPRPKKRPARANRRSAGTAGWLGTILAFALTAGVIYWCAFGYWQHVRDRDDPLHAGRVFDGRVAYSSVLASRAWHRRGAEPWDCTYAIVELADHADPMPPRPAPDRPWFLRFDGDWQATPEHPGPHKNMRRALQFCREYWDNATGDRLQHALTSPGGWYIRGPVGETLLIYSRPERIAARIRFGD